MSMLWEGVREGCGSCEFASEQNWTDPFNIKNPLVPRRFICRRYPPIVVKLGSNPRVPEQARPTMTEDGWCGEWKRKQKAPNEA